MKNCNNLADNIRHVKNIESTLMEKLSSSGLDFVRNGGHYHIPGNISLSFKNANGEALLHRLDLMRICVSTGAACDTVNTQISHVLHAINADPDYAKGTIRISLSSQNTLSDVITIGDCIVKIVS